MFSDNTYRNNEIKVRSAISGVYFDLIIAFYSVQMVIG